MSTLRHHNRNIDAADVLVETDIVTHSAARRGLAVLRIGYGITFLWAFFDKLLALGFGTGAIRNEEGARTGIDFMAQDAAWLNGGSPTEGFLSFGVPADNPFKDIFNSMAGDAWVDWLFMLGLLSIGFALSVLSTAGILLLAPVWRDALPWVPRPCRSTAARLGVRRYESLRRTHPPADPSPVPLCVQSIPACKLLRAGLRRGRRARYGLAKPEFPGHREPIRPRGSTAPGRRRSTRARLDRGAGAGPARRE